MSVVSRIPRDNQPGDGDGPALVLCESEGRWATRLLQIWPDLPGLARCVETQSLSDCVETLRSAPESLVVLEMTTNTTKALWTLETAASQISRWSRFPPRARVIVVGGRDLIPWHGFLLEAGALHVIKSLRRLETSLPVIQRWLDGFRSVTKSRHRLTPRLPWS